MRTRRLETADTARRFIKSAQISVCAARNRRRFPPVNPFSSPHGGAADSPGMTARPIVTKCTSRDPAAQPDEIAARPTSSGGRADFIQSPSDAEALAAVRDWGAWPGGAFALVGPAGSGKTHLADLWAQESGAVRIGPDQPITTFAAPAVLVEDADRRAFRGEGLFHLLNAADAGARVLLTAREPPTSWAVAVPDLRSRVNALHVAELHEPDDALLTAVMIRFFRERNIRRRARRADLSGLAHRAVHSRGAGRGGGDRRGRRRRRAGNHPRPGPRCAGRLAQPAPTCSNSLVHSVRVRGTTDDGARTPEEPST